VRKRWQLLRVDDYGNEVPGKWRDEIGYFINSVLWPTLDANQVNTLVKEYESIVCLIDTNIAAAQAQQQHQTAYSDEITPAEFETHCASALSRNGWFAHVVGQPGDQGADVIAEREGIRVVIQCKRYTVAVGNGAVQEAFAAKAYQQATHAAVVSNASFTKAARDLASTTGVLLLHPTDLDRLWSIVKSKEADAAGTA